jgi:2-iminobutanoate/2-iminopropanoate deaminase
VSQKRAIRTDSAPTPTGPFNQAIRVGNLIFTAGQAGRNRDTGQMGDVREQTSWALRNIAAILEAAGASLDDVVKTTVYLKEGADSTAMSDAYASQFHDPLPARSSVVVTRLKNAEMLVEIEAIAVVD